jgi:hypothetical protein
MCMLLTVSNREESRGEVHRQDQRRQDQQGNQPNQGDQASAESPEEQPREASNCRASLKGAVDEQESTRSSYSDSVGDGG